MEKKIDKWAVFVVILGFINLHHSIYYDVGNGLLLSQVFMEGRQGNDASYLTWIGSLVFVSEMLGMVWAFLSIPLILKSGFLGLRK